MSDDIDIRIKSHFDAGGTSAAAKGLQGVDKATLAAQKSAAQSAVQIAKLDAAFGKSAVSAQRFAQAQARTASANATAEAAMNRTALAALRLSQAQDRAAKPTRSLTDSLQGLNSTAGALGLGVAAAQVVAFGKASIDLATSTNTAKNSLQALAGSPQLYAEALEAARTQQALFGGSLKENIDGIQGLITVSRSSGVELKKLLDITQRLSVKDPAQGIAGARIALNEALAGDPTSLAKRYEIPKAALAAIRDESVSASEKLAILDQYLNQIGITSEVATGSVDANAIAFNKLGQAAETAQLQVGQLLADLARTPAEGASALLDQFTSGDALGGIQQISEALMVLSGSTSAGALAARDQAAAQMEVAGQAEASASAAAYLQGQIEALNTAQANGSISAEHYAIQMAYLKQQQAETTGATGQSTTAFGAYAAAATDAEGRTQALVQANAAESSSLVEAIAQKQAAEEKSRTLAAAQADLALLGPQVAGGLISDAQAAAVMASRYNLAYNEALKLVQAQALLARATGEARLAGQKANTRDLTGGKGVVAGAPGRGGAGDSEIARVAALQAEQKKVNDLLKERQVIQGGDKARASQIEAEIAALKAQNAPMSAIIAKENELIDVRQKVASASSKAGGAATARANAEAAASDKIIDLAEATAAKLEEIDRKSAERRAQAAQNLANTIRETSADLLASQEANDLSIVGETDEGRLADIRAREEAEAQARIATIEAISEARRIADEGDAELAQDVLDQRSEAIQKQQALDEEYNKKKAEFADNPELMAALQKEYDEATAAAEAATQVRIDLAKQEADQRIASLAAEKQAVLDDANARAAAMDSTGKNAATAQQRVDDLAAALRNIPTAVTTTVTVNEVRRGGGSSSESSGGSPSTANAAAGGGSFLTNRPTTLRVGDNPGGVEHVQVTPLSGKGQTRVGSGMIALAGGGSVVGGAADSAIEALKNAPGAAIPAAQRAASGGGGGRGGSSGESAKDALAEAKAAIDLLDAMAELREKLASVGPPLNMELVNQLAGEALEAAKALGAKFTLLSKEQADNFEIFTDTIGNAIGALSDAAGLRSDLLDIGPPMDQATVARLAYEAEQALYSIDRLLRPVAEAQAEAIERFTDASSNAIGLLSDAAGLRKDVEEIGPPLNPTVIARLASEARSAFDIIQNTLLPISEEQADAVGRYADAAGASIGLLSDAMNLSAERFVDYRSPSDAQIAMFVGDAQRIVQAVDTAAALFETEGLEAAKLWADAASGVFGAIDAGLVTFDKLRFSDISIDTQQLAAFTDATSQLLTTLSSLGAQAATLPSLEPLMSASAAVDAWSASYANLASVPFGNLGQMTGGGGSSVTVNIYNPPANLDVNALTTQIKGAISRDIGSRK